MMKIKKKKPLSVIKITEENYDFVKAICSKSGYSIISTQTIISLVYRFLILWKTVNLVV